MTVLNRRRFVAALGGLGLTAAFAPPFATPAHANEAARSLVMDAAQRLIDLVRSQASRADKEAAFLQLMEETSEMSAIARTALGVPWKSMNDAQKARYDAAFRNYLARNYVARFRDYTGEELAYVGTSQKNKNVYVETQVQSPGSAPFTVRWRLRDFGGALKIVDIEAENISLLATEREIMTSLLDRNGGDFDAFIGALERNSS